MGIAGNHRVAICLREIEQSLLRVPQGDREFINFSTQPEAQVCGYLIVSTTSRVQLAPQVTNHFHEARLDECVHVFCRLLIEIIGARLAVTSNHLERGLNPLLLWVSPYPRCR